MEHVNGAGALEVHPREEFRANFWVRLRPLTGCFRLLARMCLLMGFLVLVEVIALWGLGAKYEAPQSVRKAHVVDMSFSSDGSLVVFGSRDHGLCIWNLRLGEEVWRNESARWPWVPVAFSSDDSTVASVERRVRGGFRQDLVVLRCARTGESQTKFDPRVGQVAGLA